MIYRCRRFSFLSDWAHRVVWFFKKPYLQLRKLIDWQLNVFRHDYDFDAQFLYAIIEYKLKRVYPVLKNGFTVQDERDMKALRLAIKLAGRLNEDGYNAVELNRHNKKWGELEIKTDRVASLGAHGEPISYYCDMSRPGAKTPDDKEQERKEFLEAMNRSYAAMKRDETRLYGILSKYIRVWWE